MFCNVAMATTTISMDFILYKDYLYTAFRSLRFVFVLYTARAYYRRTKKDRRGRFTLLCYYINKRCCIDTGVEGSLSCAVLLLNISRNPVYKKQRSSLRICMYIARTVG